MYRRRHSILYTSIETKITVDFELSVALRLYSCTYNGPTQTISIPSLLKTLYHSLIKQRKKVLL